MVVENMCVTFTIQNCLFNENNNSRLLFESDLKDEIWHNLQYTLIQ